jgi:PAS domain S-box-containing protein
VTDKNKTKEQLLNELKELRQRLTELESEDKRSERAVLFDEQSKSEAILSAIGEGISIQAANFRILYQNQTHKDLFGDHVGEICYDAYRQRGDVCENCPLAESFKNGRVHNLEKKLIGNNGISYIEVTASPLKNSDGKIIAGIEIVRNITDRKKIEEALRQSEEKYRILIANIQDGVFVIQNAKIQFANEAFAKMLGYTADEILGIGIEQLIAPEDLDMVMDRYRRRLSGENVPSEYEFRLLHKDKATRVSVNMNVGLINFQGNLVSVGTIKDITEHKKLEAELQKSQRLESLGILAGGIAHDFNNILTAISGNTSLAKMYAKPGLEVYDLLTEIEKAAIRAKNLTKQLLIFSKGGALVKKTIQITRLIKETAGFTLSGSNVKCNFDIPDDLWAIEADEDQITHVINNLIINAKQAMPEGGVIDIKAKNITLQSEQITPLSEGKYIKVSVKDHGIGIPEDHIIKIFDPYFTTKQEGSGLGLATTYSIIKKHDGHITAESELGTGTTFHIYLPASDKIAPTRDITESHAAVRGIGNILVMDDDETVRLVIGRMLTQCGYEADFAEEGTKAIELYKKAKKSGKPFDVVIIDLIIPGGMGGKDAIKKLLEVDPDIKAIVSSGYSDDPIMSNFKTYGFRYALAKPYEMAELREALYKVIKGIDV